MAINPEFELSEALESISYIPEDLSSPDSSGYQKPFFASLLKGNYSEELLSRVSVSSLTNGKISRIGRSEYIVLKGPDISEEKYSEVRSILNEENKKLNGDVMRAYSDVQEELYDKVAFRLTGTDYMEPGEKRELMFFGEKGELNDFYDRFARAHEDVRVVDAMARRINALETRGRIENSSRSAEVPYMPEPEVIPYEPELEKPEVREGWVDKIKNAGRKVVKYVSENKGKVILGTLVAGAVVEGIFHPIENTLVVNNLTRNGMDRETAQKTVSMRGPSIPFVHYAKFEKALEQYNQNPDSYREIVDTFHSNGVFGEMNFDDSLQTYDILKPLGNDIETLDLTLQLTDFEDGQITPDEASSLREVASHYENTDPVTFNLNDGSKIVSNPVKNTVFGAVDRKLDSKWVDWDLDQRANFLNQYQTEEEFKELSEIVRINPTLNAVLRLGYASSSTDRKEYVEKYPVTNFSAVAVDAPAFVLPKMRIVGYHNDPDFDRLDDKFYDLPVYDKSEVVKLGVANPTAIIKPELNEERLDFFSNGQDWINQNIAKNIEGKGDESLDILGFSGGGSALTITGREKRTFGGTGILFYIPEFSFKAEEKYIVGPGFIGLERMSSLREEYNNKGIQAKYGRLSLNDEKNPLDDLIIEKYGEEYRSRGPETLTSLWKEYKMVDAEPEKMIRGIYPEPKFPEYFPISVIGEEGVERLDSCEIEVFKPQNWYTGEFFEVIEI